MNDYIALLQDLLAENLSAQQFEHEYLTLFKNDQAIRPEEEFLILDKLFSDVDSYVSDPALRTDPTFAIDEDELRRCAQVALSKLLALRPVRDHAVKRMG